MNAVILAAGTSSRFVPLSYEKPKGLLNVRGEILLERQIRQLKEAAIGDIVIVVGYKADMFQYLTGKFGVRLILNEDYGQYNNTSSMIRVLDMLDDTFICCSDIFYSSNVFLEEVSDSYYSAMYAHGTTNEYCLRLGTNDYIDNVTVGGANAWYMTGHAFFNRTFSESFKRIFADEYRAAATKWMYWEDVLIKHLAELPIKVRKYAAGVIHEFDSLEELRNFDPQYVNDAGSVILREICEKLHCRQKDIANISVLKNDFDRKGFLFEISGEKGIETYGYDICRAEIFSPLK